MAVPLAAEWEELTVGKSERMKVMSLDGLTVVQRESAMVALKADWWVESRVSPLGVQRVVTMGEQKAA